MNINTVDRNGFLLLDQNPIEKIWNNKFIRKIDWLKCSTNTTFALAIIGFVGSIITVCMYPGMKLLNFSLLVLFVGSFTFSSLFYVKEHIAKVSIPDFRKNFPKINLPDGFDNEKLNFIRDYIGKISQDEQQDLFLKFAKNGSKQLSREFLWYGKISRKTVVKLLNTNTKEKRNYHNLLDNLHKKDVRFLQKKNLLPKTNDGWSETFSKLGQMSVAELAYELIKWKSRRTLC